MDDLDVLARDFGYRPQGKSAPMRSSKSSSSTNDFDYDSIFKSSPSNIHRNGPVYDDDIFEGLPGLKTKSDSSHLEENDFFGSLGTTTTGNNSTSTHFQDLLPGFDFTADRTTNVSPHPPKQTSPLDDPFVFLDSTPVSSSSGVFTDPLKDMKNLGKSGNTKVDTSSISRGSFDDVDPLNGFNESAPPFSPDKDGREKDRSPSKSRPGFSGEQSSVGAKHRDTASLKYSESHSQKKVPVDGLHESPLFDIPSVSTDPTNFVGQNVSSPPPYSGDPYNEKNFQADVSPRSEQLPNSSGDIWLSVSEVPLYTQPTKVPPPSRPPPPIPRRTSKADFSSTRKKGEEYSPNYSSYSDSPKPRPPEGNKSSASQIDDLEDFAMGRTQNNIHNDVNVHHGEDMDAAAAAMKEAMDRAEAKFRHAKEVREREYAKAAKSKESFQAEKDEQTTQQAREREYWESKERLELERRQKEKEEEEREQKRLEKERTERERARQAVERATREARERASAEARLRAERTAVGKAQAEARDRAGKAAVQRVQAEARERAAAEAKERAEKAAAEAREKSTAEAREREAKEKAEAQRRSQRAAAERATAEARERAANAARASQQKNENDLESIFGSRPDSVPKARTSSSDPFFDQFQNKGEFDAAKRTTSTSGQTSSIKKTSSATNIVDDLSSIFGAPSSSGNFQEVEGETEDRRRARLERHQRTQERAAKALAEKNNRDMQTQRDQEERHRISETLDFEIKRWSAGKEGNLRTLLSTLQYVLWPECGWHPVSLTDLITGASVKKVYRKATLCIHPDKVQQKGATLQQKYIAEKVFDLLKEAWNKFNSEELF